MPAPVPTMLTMNAVMMPTCAPSHHPTALPTVAPTVPMSFFKDFPKREVVRKVAA